MQFSKGCKINNYLFKRLGKVVISQKLLVFEVRNKKQTCFNINFEYRRGFKQFSIQNYRGAWRGGGKFSSIFYIQNYPLSIKQDYFTFLTPKTSNFYLIITLPTLPNKKSQILQPFENCNFSIKIILQPFFLRFPQYQNSHLNQTDHNEYLKK